MTDLDPTKASTAQEIFNAVAQHLKRQGKQAVSANGVCQYRGPSGLKCAVGCLMTDDEAPGYGNGDGVDTLLKRGELPDRLRHHIQLLRRLQNIHDRCLSPDEWPMRLRLVAIEFGLDHKIVSELWGQA